jgi:large repetitive protein
MPTLRLRIVLFIVAACLALGTEVAAQGQPVDNYSALAEASALDVRSPSPTLQRLLDDGLRVPMHDTLGQPTIVRLGPGWVTAPPRPHDKAEDAARDALLQLGHLYGLTPHVIRGFSARVAHDTGFGGIIVTFTQSVDAIEVHHHRLNILLERGSLSPVAMSGYLFAGYGPAGPSDGRLAFTIPPKVAIQTAVADRHGVGVDPISIHPNGIRKDPYVHYEISPAGVSRIGPGASVQPIRIKPVFYGLPSGLVPAWYLELVSADTAGNLSTWGYVISARDAALLERNSLDFDFEYKVYTDEQGWPLDSPLGTVLSPLVEGTQADALSVFVDPVLIDVPTGNNQHGDPWLAAGATETSGNNVDAYADLTAPDGFSDGDLRGRTSAPDLFDFLFDPTMQPESSETQRLASIQNHFYLINFLHDLFYDRGFDEASGTAQVDNYGRGGREGDPILAQSHDFGGTNNANMSTPADGASPRMQMYIWTRGATNATITSGEDDPITLVGIANWGPTGFDLTAPTVLAQDGTGPATDACQELVNDVAGKIVLADRGACSFWEKVANAQNGGAVGVIVMNDDRGNGVTTMGGTPGVPITIPSLFVGQDTGVILRGAKLGASTRMLRPNFVKRAGSVDTTIVAHEWGHYLFGRLAPGQGSLQARGINEGTADFVAQLMSVRAEDVDAPGNDNWQGSYPVLLYSAGSLQGIRRVSYSADPAINGLTLTDISNGVEVGGDFVFNDNGAPNSEVHNTGEVWASVMWEVFVGLLRQHEFVEARTRMIEYMIAALKMVPPSATFIEQRDAYIAAMAAADTDDVRIAWEVFARRGMGTGAVAPPRNSNDNVGVTESFELRKDLAIVAIRLTDDLQNCDGDGVLDAGELGVLEIDIVGGALDLDDGVIRVLADQSITFPMGGSISIPLIAPGGRTTVELPVRMNALSDVSLVAFTLTATATDLIEPSIRTREFTARVNVDERQDAQRTDDVEPVGTAWTVAYDGDLTEPTAWARAELSLSEHHWFTPDFAGGVSDQYLISPELEVSAEGAFLFSFDHKYQFETTNGTHYDAGVLEITTDQGETWVDVGGLIDIGYNGQVTDLGGNARNPLFNRMAWVDKNPSHPGFDRITANLGTDFAGQTVQLRLRMGTDPAVGGEGWAVDNIEVEGTDNTPFTGLFDDDTACPNTPPIANAGADGVVLEGNIARLNGAASTDPWGRNLLYAWTQVDGPDVTLTGADAVAPTFSAPDVTADTRLTFSLVVSTDDGRASDADEVVILVQRVNNAPIADAGGDGDVAEGDAYSLDGSGSSDEDGDDLGFVWSQISGPATTLDDPESDRPSFVAPQVSDQTPLVFQLRVSDGFALSAPDTVTVTINDVNQPPVSNAGPDQAVRVRTQIALDATASTDPDGDELQYEWTQRDGPDVELSDITAGMPTFQAPYVHEDTTLTFQLVVNDGELTSDNADEVVITVFAGNDPPVAHAGEAGEVDENEQYQLDGTRSSDPDSDDLTFLWAQVAGPATLLSSPRLESPTFIAPEVGEDTPVVFELLVSDGQAISEPSTVEILVRQVNQPPVAHAGDDQAVVSGGETALDGSESSDPDGDELTYAWTQVAGPEITVSAADVVGPTFVAPEVEEDTTLVFELTVSDAEASSGPDVVQILVVQGNQPPVADAGDDLEVAADAAVRLNGNASSDPDGDELDATWTQVAGPEVTVDGVSTFRPTFTAPALDEDITLTFSLVVTDGVFVSDADTVDVVVIAANQPPIADAGGRLEVDEGAIVQLDGTASADPEGEALTFSWTQLAGPPAVFTGNDATPTVATPEVGEDTTLTFQLVVSDGLSLSEPATVDVLVRNLNKAPLAVAGADANVEEGASVTLDGSASRDPDGGSLRYAWSQVDGEPEVELADADTAAPTFEAPVPEGDEIKLTFELTVTDAAGDTSTDSVVITVARRAGVTAQAASEDGCGCDTVGRPAPRSPWALFVGAMLLVGVVGRSLLRR